MTGERGERTVNSHPLCLCTFNWAFRSGIINMQLQSPRESAGELRTSLHVCLVCGSAWEHTGGSRLICVPWVNHSHSAPLCAERERERKQEANLDMRSQIIHLTLRQEGSTGHRRAKLKQSEGAKKRKKRTRGGDKREKSKQKTRWCKRRTRAACAWHAYEKPCLCDEGHGRLGRRETAFAFVFSLSRWQRNFIACSFRHVQQRVLILHWWPSQITAKIWIMSELNWPLNTQ